MFKPFSIAGAVLGAMSVASAPASSATADERSAFDFTLTAIDGTPLELSQFRGKALLVVNTASLCGFTRQYEGLQVLWQAHRDRGLVVIAIPSNDFGGQEPKSENEIQTFCQGAFGVTFPLAEKTRVSGPSAHPFYRWAVATLGQAARPRWNFHKYVIGSDGRIVGWFPATVGPSSSRLKKAIEAALPAPSR